ncbi:hypothetical protein [Polymorphospora rubra]|uniref:Uncharacterized protein n=1 Tax=Polymorphospora rubra TaxID=338584 RepID=A0A810MV85_9ACTN|nr:hypothetical protein [Polymorphospora rubra]BCJ65087.1 hypothetical protein Prubr_21080 [Polymorphospora rubra]
MTSTTEGPAMTETRTLQWGVRLTLPSTKTAIEIADGPLDAENQARRLSRLQPGTVEVVYREVVAGPWFHEDNGDEYAVKFDWPDRRIEIKPASGRLHAERCVEEHAQRSGKYHSSMAAVVSRAVFYGEWLPSSWRADW